ncbi:uncharacterized protein [Dermacentor andersoni]|uniref:uncharacterized protein n=1 Tax=Dermacentor andersoni TaxID=34620 RepID=UPI002416E1B1|nr:uncharacterized protein LOC129380540 [Dermacentor andersoni]XP_054917794.1 uncharacterized protein LOC129380540 [Dermacentor andersoni]
MKLHVMLMAAVATSFAFGQNVVYGPPVLDPSSQEGQTQQQYQQQNQPFRQQQKQQQQQQQRQQQRLTFKKNVAQAVLQKTNQDERCLNGRCQEVTCTAKRIVRLLRRRCILAPTGAAEKCLDNRCVRYILDKNGCNYEDLPTWIFDREIRSSRNFPAVCQEGTNAQISSAQSSAEALQTQVTQSQRYSTAHTKTAQAQLKQQSSLQYSEGQQKQLAPTTGAALDSAYNSGELRSLIIQSRLAEPLAYSYGMVYPQVPLFFVYLTQPYDFTQGQYMAKESLEQYSPTGSVASKGAMLKDLFGDQGLAVISEASARKFSTPILTWSSGKRMAAENQGQTKRRVTRDGGWHASEQTAVQSYQPFSTTSAGQAGLQAEVKSAKLAKLAASSLSGAASAALTEAAAQQQTQQQVSGARDAAVSSGGFYREAKRDFSQVGAADTSASQQEEQEVSSQSSQEEIAAQSSELADAQQPLQEVPSAPAQPSLYSEQASGQQTASSSAWSGGVRRQKVAKLGGTKGGGTKGIMRTLARKHSWTRNSLGYSG